MVTSRGSASQPWLRAGGAAARQGSEDRARKGAAAQKTAVPHQVGDGPERHKCHPELYRLRMSQLQGP